MNMLIKLFAAFWLVVGTQACTTSGSTPSAATPADPGAPQDAPAPTGTSEDLIPAIIGIPPDPGPTRAYRISPNDLLKIEVFQVDELATEGRVNQDGSIVMPLIGKVKVSGLTLPEAQQTIADRLGEQYLNNPQVNILVSESAGQRVTVRGHVKKPGVFPLVGQMTLMQAIAMAGGLDEVAKKEEIVLFREQEQGKINGYVINLASIDAGKLTDPLVIPDDRIVVPKSGTTVLGRMAERVLTGWVLRIPLPLF